jgi:hypothetical protein
VALNIETEEADRLARELAEPLTKEERLAALTAVVADMRRHVTDFTPVTKAEWDEINGDTD